MLLLRKNAGNATTNDQNMQHMFRQSQRLLQAEREARDIQLGRAIDYVNEADEKKLYRGGDTAGNVMDRSERPTQRPSSMVDRLGALVVIDAGTRTGGYENRIGLVCKLCNEQRITLSLLKEKGNGKDLTQGLHSKRISKMVRRRRLLREAKMSNKNTASRPPEFHFQNRSLI